MNKFCFNMCEGCNTFECEYVELERFMDEYNAAVGKNFELEDCPDKAGLGYTCDLLFSDKNTQEKLYIEVKEVQFGVGKGKKANIILGEINGQNDCAGLVCTVIDSLLDEDIQSELSEFVVTIPRIRISENEKEDFCNKLAGKLKSVNFDASPFSFIFNGKHGDIEINFTPKTEEEEEKFGDGTLFAYVYDQENTLEDIFNKVTNVSLLLELINKNIEATSQKKFPVTADKKILLNILKLPNGYDVFFYQHIEYIASEINNAKLQNNTAATEIYLLFYCEDYMIADNNIIKKYGKTLFVIPVISGVFDKPTMFVEELA